MADESPKLSTWFIESYRNVYSNKLGFKDDKFVKVYHELFYIIIWLQLSVGLSFLITGPVMMTQGLSSKIDFANAQVYGIESCSVNQCMLYYTNEFKNITIQRSLYASSPDPSFEIQEAGVQYHLSSAECIPFSLTRKHREKIYASVCDIWYSYVVEGTTYRRMETTIMNNFRQDVTLQYAVDSPGNKKYENKVTKTNYIVGLTLTLFGSLLIPALTTLMFMFHTICYAFSYTRGYLLSLNISMNIREKLTSAFNFAKNAPIERDETIV